MKTEQVWLQALSLDGGGASVSLGVVRQTDALGRIRAELVASPGRTLWCRVLETHEGDPLLLRAGDEVLVWLADLDAAEPFGVVLGRIGCAFPRAADESRSGEVEKEMAPSQAAVAAPTDLAASGDAARSEEASGDPPDEIVIEAGKRFVLKCGEARIEFREDGRLLIRGTDVVSSAKRTNRIKGGSVAIN